MKIISIEELKALQVEMLVCVDQFCKKNNIRYFIGYGTLLGAIRHKGYIPWDEDIDIGMPRPDYDLFLRNFNGTYENLFVNAPELDWEYFEPYANVYDNRTILYEEENSHHGIEVGVKIDVFPLDGVPEDITEYRIHRKKLRNLNSIRGSKKEKFWAHFIKTLRTRKGVRAFLKRFLRPFTSYAEIQKEIRSLAVKYNWDSSTYVDKITFQNLPETRLPRKVYEDYIEVPFEGHMFKSPANYDLHLKSIYGDYMKLPPVEERVFQHGFKAYWKD